MTPFDGARPGFGAAADRDPPVDEACTDSDSLLEQLAAISSVGAGAGSMLAAGMPVGETVPSGIGTTPRLGRVLGHPTTASATKTPMSMATRAIQPSGDSRTRGRKTTPPG